MSQEKVERYKEQKANRKEIMRKQKRKKILVNSALSLVVVAAIVWVVGSGVNTYLDSIPTPQVEVDYTALSDYETSLNKTEKDKTEKEDAKEEKTESTDAESTDAESTDAEDKKEE